MNIHSPIQATSCRRPVQGLGSTAHFTTQDSIGERLRYAIQDADTLGIGVCFFETPHYAALWYRKMLIATYFSIMYEPRWSGSETEVCAVSVDNREVIFVPTPLGYITYPVEDTDRVMIDRIRNQGYSGLGSFYYHPYIEFGNIAVHADEGGYPFPEYATSSPLHRLVDAFLEEGYTFRAVTSLKN